MVSPFLPVAPPFPHLLTPCRSSSSLPPQNLDTSISEPLNKALTIAFAVEVACKLVAFGPLRFFSDAFNRFDLFVVLASAPDLIVVDGASFGFLRMLRLFRLLRSFRALMKVPSVRVLFRAALSGLPDTMNFVALFLLFLYIFTLAGMQLTNSSNADDADDGSSVLAIGGNATTRSSRRSFDDLTSATVSSLQLITGAGWTSLVHHALHSSPTLAIIIPFAVLFGKYWLLQLLTGVFIARLPEQPILRRSEAHRSGLRSGRQAVREALREEHEQLAGAAPGRRVRCQSAPAEAPTAMSKEGGVPAGSDARVSPETDTAATVRRGAGPQHWARSIVSWQWSRAPSVSFDGLVLTCIMASLVCLTLETALDASAEAVLLGADIALTSIFTLELLLQIASAGGIRRWTAVGWNVLDGIIVASALLSLALRYIVGVEGDEAAAMKSFRTLRVLRPLRLIKSSPRLQSTVDTILTTLPHTLAILLMAIFSWFLLAVVGNLLFGHVQLRECHGASAALSPSACLAVGGELIPQSICMTPC